jgi:phage regulator Rha-like protein
MNTAMRAILMEPPTKYAVANQPDTAITDRIHMIRGQKVMLDRDLAELYGVEVKRLKEQVRRNASRFPEDFMFELTKAEWDPLRSQFATLKQGAHTKYLPFAFTEHGILMLANVLRSEQAIAVSIRIIRVFNRMREVLLSPQVRSSRGWSNWKAASPVTTRRSKPSSITSRSWSPRPEADA